MNTSKSKNSNTLTSQFLRNFILIVKSMKKLNEALHFEKASNNPHQSFTTATGWAMPVENPDASHIEENKDE